MCTVIGSPLPRVYTEEVFNEMVSVQQSSLNSFCDNTEDQHKLPLQARLIPMVSHSTDVERHSRNLEGILQKEFCGLHIGKVTL